MVFFFSFLTKVTFFFFSTNTPPKRRVLQIDSPSSSSPGMPASSRLSTLQALPTFCITTWSMVGLKGTLPTAWSRHPLPLSLSPRPRETNGAERLSEPWLRAGNPNSRLSARVSELTDGIKMPDLLLPG